MPNEMLHPTGLPLSGKGLEGLQTRDRKPLGSPSGVDQLRGGEARPRTQVSEVALRRARLNAHQRGPRPEPIRQTRRRQRGRPSGAESLAAGARSTGTRLSGQSQATASHSSRPSIGIR